MDCMQKLSFVPARGLAAACLSAVVLIGLCAPLPAHAYIDPNAGGMLYQALFPILAALVGGWTLLRNWFAAQWARIRRTKRSDDSSGADQ